MAKTKADYMALGKADAKLGTQVKRPASGWQFTAYMEGWQEELDEAAAPRAQIVASLASFGVTVADQRPTRVARDAKRKAGATLKRFAFVQRMQMCDKATKALTAVRGRDTGYASKNIKRGDNW